MCVFCYWPLDRRIELTALGKNSLHLETIADILALMHHAFCPFQTPTCLDTSSWQRWRWARVDSENGKAARRPRANPFQLPGPPVPFNPFGNPTDPSSLLLLRLLTAAQTEQTQPPSWWHTNGAHINNCLLLSPLLSSRFLPQGLWFLSLDTISSLTWRKSTENKRKTKL